jgi:hypothetical protein
MSMSITELMQRLAFLSGEARRCAADLNRQHGHGPDSPYRVRARGCWIYFRDPEDDALYKMRFIIDETGQLSAEPSEPWDGVLRGEGN